MVDEDGTNLLCCNVLTWEQLVPASSKGLRRNARYLEKKATTMAPEPFIELQQSLGMTYHKHALFLERQLDDYVDPVEVYMHDWMHALFVDGVFNFVLYLLLESVIQIGFPEIYAVFKDYIATWKWPDRVHSYHLHEIFF